MIIGFDKGHTIRGKGTGAVGIKSETGLNRPLGDRIINKLRQLGHTVIDCTVDEGNNSLSQICANANRQHIDIFISLHFNCGGGQGVEVLVYDSNSKLANTYARKICDEISKLGFRNRGVKNRSDLYVLNSTKSEALLIEVAFIDSEHDMNLYDEEKVANSIVYAITGKCSDISPIPQPTVNSTEGIAYCTVDTLNVRDGASTNYSIQGELNLNEKVTVLEKDGDWRKVRYYNAPKKQTMTGWVNANYLIVEKDVQVVQEKPKKYWIVTDYIPQGEYGVEIKSILSKYFHDIQGGIYVRTNYTKGMWIETCYLPLEKCNELKERLGKLFWEIKFHYAD